MDKIKNDKLIIEFDHTKYDDDLLGGKTIRINEISLVNKINNLQENDLKQLLYDNGIVFAQYRIPATDLKKRKVLNKLNFYYISTVTELKLEDIQSKTFSLGENVEIKPFEKGMDESIIMDIALNNFGHGVFYEDHNLQDKAVERFKIILEKYLDKDDWKIVLLKNLADDKIVSWAIWHWEDENLGLARAELLGTKFVKIPRLGTYTANAMFTDIKKHGAEKCDLNITITNLPMATIYMRLGLKFKYSTEIYHYIVN